MLRLAYAHALKRPCGGFFLVPLTLELLRVPFRVAVCISGVITETVI